MLRNLPQFVPQRACLSCDGCCRFADCASFWRPRMAEEEIDKSSPSAGTLLNNIDDDYALCAVEQDGQPQCVFLQTNDNTCRVYPDRPFDCRLYPFLLIKKDNKTALGVHLSCPYVREKRTAEDFEGHVELLREFFQQTEIREFIKRNPALFGEYPGHEQEIECLFAVAAGRS